MLRDPFYLGDDPALTQNSGLLDAWRPARKAFVVTAETGGAGRYVQAGGAGAEASFFLPDSLSRIDIPVGLVAGGAAAPRLTPRRDQLDQFIGA